MSWNYNDKKKLAEETYLNNQTFLCHEFVFFFFWHSNMYFPNTCKTDDIQIKKN